MTPRQAHANPARRKHGPGRSGQAMVELLVGLVVLVVLFAGLLQVASLSKTHNETMVVARRKAGALAMLEPSGGIFTLSPDYIRDWHEGSDQKRHTKDDVFTDADPVLFENTIVEKAAGTPYEWQILDGAPTNGVVFLHGNINPESTFGLLKGHDSQNVLLLPGVRSLLYKADSIDVECDVWMTWTKGIY